ncbi:MAG: hypothetical protein HY670_07965 [Chloroflexi bacterium]|nr:hypothetical protein [Chloroflexota bacterium]
MRLEMASFPLKDVRIGGQTTYHNGTLEINKEELRRLVLEDKRVLSADLDVAFPGEQTRIMTVRDIVEPRIKVSGPGCVFPGIMGPVETVGEGRTHRLSGCTVIASAEYRPTILGGTAAQVSGFVDMWGPGSLVTPFGSTINIVLILKLVDGVTELDAHSAIQLAEFKVAHELAKTTTDRASENVEVFELSAADPSLPRVVYILGARTAWHEPHSLTAYYGLPIRESLPTLIHPNEFLDGAVTTDTRRGNGNWIATWGWMNQPVVLGLLREHGKSLNFLGVILQRTRFETEFGKQVSAVCASQMAKLLGANGAVITRTGASGNNFIDAMLTVKACERKGVKTVLLTPEWGGKDGAEMPLVFYVPEANAMVSTGSQDREVKVGAPTKVIGAANHSLNILSGNQPVSPWSSVTLGNCAEITGVLDWWGGMRHTRKEY